MVVDRNIRPTIMDALADTPVVLLNGARQTGKSTLAKQIAQSDHPALYLTFDDATTLAAAESDPAGFIRSLQDPVVLDEVQRVPAVFRQIKAEVDRDRRPGRFLLTGSADILLLPQLSESLAGRMEIFTLWPFSQGELEGRMDRFVDLVFSNTIPQSVPPTGSTQEELTLWGRVLRGGFPEIVARQASKRRSAWFEAYITTILQRDVRDLANIEGLTQLPRLLSLIGLRSMSTVNYSELSRSSGIAQSTLKRYLTLLEATYLVTTLQAWHANVGKRLIKSPKLLLSDTGLAAHLRGTSEPDTLRDRNALGPLLENFVAMELRKQASWSDTRPKLYHFRSQTGDEVDLIMEDARGRLVGIEVKASASVSSGDLKGLRALRDIRPNALVRGIVLYTGENVVGFEPDMMAVPIAALWSF